MYEIGPATGGAVDQLLPALARAIPGVSIERLQVTHAGDDDHLWYVWSMRPAEPIQIEVGPSGDAPFLIEGNDPDQMREAANIDEAIELISMWLAD
jgi:hypothetical protein